MFNIVALGGTAQGASSTEMALQVALNHVEPADIKVELFGGTFLAELPFYGTCGAMDVPQARILIDSFRNADGVLIASPGYHGSISGLVKNALDYLEETARDSRVYLDALPVGLIVTAYGAQATGSTMAALRSIVHALRAWPTPFGATIISRPGMFTDGRCMDDSAAAQLAIVGRQVSDYTRLHATARRAGASAGVPTNE